VTEANVILRKWTGRIRTSEQREYVDYVLATGAGDYDKTPGNLGYQILLRDRGDGVTEITTLSWWRSMDDIRAFAGPEPEAARYYPQDDRYLLDRPMYVEHHRVIAGRIPEGSGEAASK
jgi:heme-degrading monooxygenase HmoA